MASTSLQRALLFAQLEFVRFLFSKRGIVALVSYLAIWSLILTKVVAKGASLFKEPRFEGFISGMLGEIGLANLSHWPVPELIVFWLVAAFTFPFFAMFASADQLCGDKARGTLRFLLLRAKREELLIGRFVGQYLVVLSFIVIALMATNLLVFLNNGQLFAEAIKLSLPIVVGLSMIVLPVIAFMSLLNTYSSSSKQAIIHCLLILTLGQLIFGLLTDYVWQGFSISEYFFPMAGLIDILSLNASTFQQYWLPLMQTLIYLVVAHAAFKKQGV